MATLIGLGAHAADIVATRTFDRVFAHHDAFVDDGRTVIIGINDPRTRAGVAARLGVADGTWVHPHAWLGPGTVLGYGTHVNYRASMTRTTVGRHCTISPGATICGDVTIGDRVLVGAGATICDRVTIGDDVTIGAGAVVLPETVVPSSQTWVGVPARPR